MKIDKPAGLLAAALLLCSGLAQAAPGTVWRCGEQGREYSDRPCAQGQALVLDDGPSTAQTTAAQLAAAQERQRAKRLVQERERRERAAHAQNALPAALRVQAAAPAAAPAAASKRPQRHHASRQKPSGDGIWQAVAPASRRARD